MNNPIRNESNIPAGVPSSDSHKNAEAENKSEGLAVTKLFKNAANPLICILTVAFKLSAIVSFILLDLFTNSEALVYLLVILLGAADFWMTKNISGRILVGLRWWNEVKDNGEEVWIYESKHEKLEHGADQKIFWGSLYINAGCWIILFVWEVIRLKMIWAIIALISLAFAGTNFYGYFKCSKSQQESAFKLGAKYALSFTKKGAEAAQQS